MYYIHAASSISHQDTFRKKNVLTELMPLIGNTELISPDYKEFIPPASLRRLSPILKIGLATSIECKNEVNKEFDAIVVGTALGCLRDTEKFLVTINTTTSEFLSPTAFIQSTHNTIGGQISLGLDNHAYNMTHTQNNLSFEISLLDALMCIDEGKENVLVGSADEHIDFLDLLQPKLLPSTYPLTSGGSFFALSPESSENGVGVKAVSAKFNSTNLEEDIVSFLEKENIKISEIDAILHSNCNVNLTFENAEQINYLQYSGIHYSASAFALHMAHDYLNTTHKSIVLIVNNLCSGNLGLILVGSK